MRPADFLKKYDTVIFDMDGVITSEQNYWDIAALSVYELINDYFGSESVGRELQSERSRVRKSLFFNDAFITAVKNKGVNSNWDLCYLAFCYLVKNKFTPEEMTRHVENFNGLAFDLYEEAAHIAHQSLGLPLEQTKRGASLWLMCRKCFQEWYLGDDFYRKMNEDSPAGKGKTGMWQTEEPLLPLNDTVALLKTLSESGLKLGIATGRSEFEITKPLKQWDCLKYFSPISVAGYDYVVSGEEKLRAHGIEATLTKPHPYLFLKALYGTDFDDVKLYKGEYDTSLIGKALMVGDAGSDILAAKAMGADFLAVLTGVNGEKSRSYFEKEGAKYILPNVLYMLSD